MSRMITRNGGARQADGSSAVVVDKLKDSGLPADASASSAIKRTSDLFTEADNDALQPAAQGAKDAVRELLATGSGDNVQRAGVDSKVKANNKGDSGSLQAGKEDAITKSAKQDEEEEDDGYLSDDPEERYDAHAKSEVAQRIRFAIVLLIPIVFKSEATWVQATLRALFNLWKKDLNMEIQATTKFQELTALFLNKKQYHRLQVSFERARDANFVWKHGIVHTCVDGKRINLDWQHPVDPAYVKARAADPLLVEVLFKGVDAVITPEMLCDMLVSVKLEKRGRSAFKEGCCFHRVVNPVTGMDTDKVKGLVKQHEGDKITDLTRLVLKDPAVVLISTGGNREEWICVQECCEKAAGVSFAQAAEHVVSQRHSDGLVSGSVSRSSKAGVNLVTAKKEFGV
ncbi:unnamed protein product [Closterium sp. Naga37s-1]|nr:unnamed protein product [Closterium sp. Naga37s-1]